MHVLVRSRKALHAGRLGCITSQGRQIEQAAPTYAANSRFFTVYSWPHHTCIIARTIEAGSI